ncbi:MAG: Phage portal protein, HK97 [Candidatus Collierbacteria bacterium GW2011_GWB1_44_6]|uniref:Phage portal protein, HK97 n=1 Tax=Candidatus Collierbacteria bacterium GW2011_GWB1_44_6 TaxID=1618384 RepID=A0A0G1JN19_9BACT|nr:MAG: Phage portal protein, HK97 [Candidatus Collierbacteria bacterium GW2011_GWB1_44_6]
MFENIKKIFRKGASLKGLVYGNNSWISSPWAESERIKSYGSSVYVHACVKKRGEKFGQLINFNLKRRGSDKEISEHWILDLLDKPNNFQNKNEFFELYQTFKDLTGSVFVYLLKIGEGKNARVKEMHLLSPDKVTVVVNEETGLPAFYKYNNGKGGQTIYNADDVVASFYPNPIEFSKNSYKGFSSLMPLGKRVETEQQLVDYQYNILKNGGKVEGILKFKTEVMDLDKIEEVKVQYDQQFAEAKRSGRPLILYGDTEYEKVGQSMEELAYLDSLKFTRDDVLMIFGVPKTVLGLTDGVQKGNYDEANSMFIKDTIKPLIENCVTKLNEFLAPPDVLLDFVDPTPEDVDLKLKKIENGTANYYMTTNEKRALMNMEPLPDGDVILVPFSLTPMDTVTDPIEPTAEQKGLKKKLRHPLTNPIIRKQYYGEWIKLADRREGKMKIKLDDYLRAQRNRVLDNLSNQRFFTKALSNEVFDMRLEVGLGEKVIIDLIKKYLIQSGEDAMKFVGYDKPFIVTADLQAMIEKRNEFFAKEINRTTFDTLKRQFAEANDNNESRDQLVKRIRDTYGDISKGRATTIARTETLVASQTGKFSGYKQSGIDIKIWVAVMDDATRDSHASLDGEEKPIDMPFSNGLMYPGDESGSAEEVINCRCSV